jgi:hypothetical protein
MAVLTLVLTLGVFSVARHHFVAANLWQQVKPYARPEMEFATIDFGEPSMFWEFRQGITNYAEPLPPQQASAFLARPGPRVLVVPTEEAEPIRKSLGTEAVCVRATGLDTVSFKRHDLTAIILP